FGGTGEGKTTAIIKPIFKQVVAIKSKKFGAMAMDAKGVFYRDLKKAADAAGRGDDVVLIGPDAEMMGIDILSNLRPSDLSAACKSVMTSAGGSGDNAFWSDMAATLIGHAASLVFGVANLKKSNGQTASDYYTISNIYQIIISEHEMSVAISLFDSVDLRADYFSDDYDQIDQLRVSIDYLNGAWAEMAAATKTGIIANVSKILDPIYANPALGRKFSAANADAQSITDIFDGKLFLFSISSIEHNIAAKLLQILIKSSFYRAARIREIRIGSVECNKKPVLVVIDEAQELLSADTSGLSDGSYWNVARSGGVAGIIGTQTIAALYQAMGREQANNLVQQFRSKVFLRTEDTESHRYCIELAGQERRAMTYQTDTSESLEQLVNISNVNFSDYHNETESAADFAANISKTGIVSILSSDHQIQSKDAIDAMFSVDNRFTPSLRIAGLGTPENINDKINYMRDATWRAEDKYREWMREGNDAAPLLNVSDIINAGRYYAYAHIQRAGIPVQDVIEIKHDFN
ncbi:type IV secretory system conjugative DNA transfer family protein, partial [Methylicorpusculum sp.]|uniref:type IV secretory system conjugative DNA transfer family protein n=1 Tax=Methylicorpusculum sp. TaxID=2713644 RepID=UPI002ABA1E4B